MFKSVSASWLSPEFQCCTIDHWLVTGSNNFLITHYIHCYFGTVVPPPCVTTPSARLKWFHKRLAPHQGNI